MPKSTLSLIVSAESSYIDICNELYDVNQDEIAGRLNYDTLIKALNDLQFFQYRDEGGGGVHHFDVLERRS